MRREGDGLRVVAGGKRHDATIALRLRELQQAIQRAANLEAAGMLQALGLQQHSRARELVQGLRLEQRCLDEAPAHARGGGARAQDQHRL